MPIIGMLLLASSESTFLLDGVPPLRQTNFLCASQSLIRGKTCWLPATLRTLGDFRMVREDPPRLVENATTQQEYHCSRILTPRMGDREICVTIHRDWKSSKFRTGPALFRQLCDVKTDRVHRWIAIRPQAQSVWTWPVFSLDSLTYLTRTHVTRVFLA